MTTTPADFRFFSHLPSSTSLSATAFLFLCAASPPALAQAGKTTPAALSDAPAESAPSSTAAATEGESTPSDEGEGEGSEEADEPTSEASENTDESTDQEDEPVEASVEPAPAPAAVEPVVQPEPPYDGPATLLGDDEELDVGGYAGLFVGGTTINKSAGVLLGGEAAFLLDHRFSLGLAGYGLSSEVRGPNLPDGDHSVLGFGYGGVSMRYHFMSKRSPVTVSVGSLIGAGGLTLLRKTDDFDWEEDDAIEANAFFVAEPTVQVHLHMTRWMRFGVGGGYRFVRGPSLGTIEDSDLEGATFGGHLQFGWF